MDLVDLTGSDSENEGEVTHMDKLPSSQTGRMPYVISRELPSWASASSSNSDSLMGLSQRLLMSDSNSRNTGNGRIIPSDNSFARRRLPPSLMPNVPGIKIADSGSQGVTRNSQGAEEASLRSQGGMLVLPTGSTKLNSGYNDNYHFSRVQPNGNSISKADDKLNPQFGLKRSLPLSFLSTMPTTNEQADQNVYAGGDLNLENDDEIFIYETRSTGRFLPPSLTQGKTFTTTQIAGIGDTAHRIGEERAKETDERLVYQAALQDLSQPKLETNLPDGVLAVPLLRHQRIALAWMVQKETNSFQCLGGILADDQGLGKTISVIALILMERPSHSKFISDSLQNVRTEALNLDEDDDNVSELEKIKQIPDSDNYGRGIERKGRPAAGTLVVCPASVVRQWARELDEKVTQGAKLSVLIYHGSSRTKDPFELATFDVVVTTYSIVSNEVPKQSLVDDDDEERRNMERYGLSSEFATNKKMKKASNTGKKGRKGKKGIDDSESSLDPAAGPLARVRWFRVVLDEAQTIKNHKTQVARACCGLRAKRRWCLSGTPIQNSVDDLYSYFRFLKYDPYAVYKSFCSTIKYPISKNATSGYKKLQAVLQTILLRRTKGTLIDGEPIIKLPPKSISLKKVEFSAEERSFYTKLEADSRKQFKAYAAAGTVKQNYANILLMLLRLRQACDHPFLVKGYHSDSDGKLSLDMARKLPRDTQISLLNQLEVSLAICGICNDTPDDAVITLCGHVFCYQCVCDRLEADDNMCPANECKGQIGMDSLFSRATLRGCISGHPDDNSPTYSGFTEKSEIGQDMCSSKIKAALEILQSLCKFKNLSSSNNFEGCEERTWDHPISQEIPEKAIVFSQWTGMLDLLEIPLKNSCIQYRRLDGTMSLAARDRAIKDFICNPEVTVIIMSLKAGNLGLNMVAACHVLLLDLWWNPTTEDQAIDRAHRIGQTRPVTVSRLTIKDTVEDRILALQEDKRAMVASAFGEDQTGGSATRLTVEDLRYLFMV